jgi:hypothetical protein
VSRLSSRYFGDAFVAGVVVRGPFVVVEDFAVCKVMDEFAGAELVRLGVFAGLACEDDGDEDSTRFEAGFCGFEKISLQIVRDDDEIPGGFFDLVFTGFEIGYDRREGLPFEPGYFGVDGGDGPALLREPDRVAAFAAG